MFFFWVLLNPQTTDSPTNQPQTQRHPESMIIFERIGNSNVHFAEHKCSWENI